MNDKHRMPKVSVIVSTYGRWWLLEEMLQSYLKQDYPGHLEMIVVNDAPVELIAPPWLPSNRSVEIVNLPEPAPSNPYKRMLGLAHATGKWATYYDDDDLMLPHRFTRQVECVENLGADYLACHVAGVWQDGRFIEITDNFFFCSHLWLRDRMPLDMAERPQHWDDVAAARTLLANGAAEFRIDRANANPDDVVHIYRWGGGEAHHSGIAGDATALAKERTFKQACMQHPRWRTGRVELSPHFHRDYHRLWLEYLPRGWAEYTERNRDKQA